MSPVDEALRTLEQECQMLVAQRRAGMPATIFISTAMDVKQSASAIDFLEDRFQPMMDAEPDAALWLPPSRFWRTVRRFTRLWGS